MSTAVLRGTRRNWAGNVVFGAGGVICPTSVDQVRALVATRERVRAVGTAHSFNDLADSPESTSRSPSCRP